MVEREALLSKRPPRGLAWEPTIWSMVGVLDDRDDPRWQQAWAELSRNYRVPMETYAHRRLRRAPVAAGAAGDAEDLVQAFLAVCIEKGWLSDADPAQGRFRAWVQRLLRWFINGWVRYRMREKRRPPDGSHIVPLMADDENAGLPDAEDDAADAFDRSWTEVAVEAALQRLRGSSEDRYLVLKDLIATEGAGSPDMPQRLGKSVEAYRTMKSHARRTFRLLFQEEFRKTVRDPDDFEAEWRALQPYMP